MTTDPPTFARPTFSAPRFVAEKLGSVAQSVTSKLKARRAGAAIEGMPPAGSWALVTGASGGIGEAFVAALARHGVNSVITGRRDQALQATAEAARAQGVQVEVITGDLGDKAFRDDLVAEISRQGWKIQTLINNAGFGVIGDFSASAGARNLELLQVNCAALTDLSHRYLPGMLQAHQGTIINVASTASFQPVPAMAVYAASKAYVRSFTEALWHEVKGTGVRVIALCPGPTETGFFSAAGDAGALTWRRTPEQVVETCFAGLVRQVPTVVDGPLNLAQTVAPRLVPTQVAMTIGEKVMKKH